jgi:hypothetical protein
MEEVSFKAKYGKLWIRATVISKNLSKGENSWYHLRCGNQEFFIFAEYVRPIKAA